MEITLCDAGAMLSFKQINMAIQMVDGEGGGGGGGGGGWGRRPLGYENVNLCILCRYWSTRTD